MPGSTTDTVPTMLTPGEFVIKRESAKMLGKPFLEKLNAISDNSSHSAIDALISQATLSQMQPMMGGGVVNEYMGGGSVDNYMGGGMIDNYMYGGGVKKKKKMAGYQEGGDVSPEMLMDLAKIKNLNYTQPSFMLPIMESLNNLKLSDVYMDSVRSDGDTEMFDRLISLASKFGQKNDNSGERYKPLSDEEILDFYNKLKKDSGYQDGGAVGDATSVSLEGLLSELQKKKPISNYSMVDADRVDAENQEILDFIINSVMPGGVMGRVAKETGKLPKLAKKFASLAPDKGKQKVLDKIADEMTLPPTRPTQSFSRLELINPGYLQKFKNTLVKARESVGSVKKGDIVDADYPRGYFNINEYNRDIVQVPKKLRMEMAKDLLKSFDINLRKVKGKQEGGEVADSLFGMSMDEFNKILARELLESSMTGENTPMRIELSPEEDRFRNNPNPDKPFGMTILDDLLLRAYEQYKFGKLPFGKD